MTDQRKIHAEALLRRAQQELGFTRSGLVDLQRQLQQLEVKQASLQLKMRAIKEDADNYLSESVVLQMALARRCPIAGCSCKSVAANYWTFVIDQEPL